MRNIFTALLVVASGVSLNAFAGKKDTPVTQIENADLVCSSPGAQIAVDSTVGHERIWQSDPGEKEGLELKILEFNRGACDKCFDIKAQLTFYGESSELRFKSEMKDSNLTMTILTDGNVGLNLECR